MAAYFIVDIKVTNPQLYDEYRNQVGATLQKYGGKFIVRGGQTEVIEGVWPIQRLVILEFDDAEHFKRWYHSPEYTKIRAIRMEASEGRAMLVQGVE
ncbi:hypothetical protein KDA_03410 [Dictyobacter alpinus]|uniref:DUF1330 domain-containing protein n=1 Tax=Dictyobacter alpinus TaxID=2014873 RepID=A0A402B0L6_9CHLR|nr:DUF1330 domain-containing protein [Dictyobacter alpinus]GCE24857.1 hypothetical protein KDA_03410 [Dictyobacter alpinus]